MRHSFNEYPNVCLNREIHKFNHDYLDISTLSDVLKNEHEMYPQRGKLSSLFLSQKVILSLSWFFFIIFCSDQKENERRIQN